MENQLFLEGTWKGTGAISGKDPKPEYEEVSTFKVLKTEPAIVINW